jgi:hypothetical protein
MKLSGRCRNDMNTRAFLIRVAILALAVLAIAAAGVYVWGEMQ